jgi:hypothetical protein
MCMENLTGAMFLTKDLFRGTDIKKLKNLRIVPLDSGYICFFIHGFF